jgi:murein DD-endopeptidase MepM/ murein hydrolase activator NlpD
MKQKTVTVMWMPSAKSAPRTFSIPHVYLYICLGLLVFSWLLLGIGGYLGQRLYRDSTKLQAQNAQLLHEVKDLDTLRHTIKQIQKDESVIRDFLGLDGGQAEGSNLGQGGEPSPDLSTIAVKDAMTISTASVPAETHSTPLVKRAQSLQADLQELVGAMWDQKQALDSTPSIVPLQSQEYWLASGFGWRRSPFSGVKEFHNGLDICGRKRTPIIAPADGVVYRRSRHKYLGRYIRINHGKGVTTTYGHLAGYNVEKGQKVKRGEVIAFMGNSGRSTGTHLHYSVRVNKKYVNPFHYILNTKKNRLVDFYLKAEGRNPG